MRYYTVLQNGEEKVAASSDGAELFLLEGFSDMQELIEKGGVREIPAGAEKCTGAKLLSPIPRPAQDILCLGINYLAHAEESARFKKEAFAADREYPIFFSKRTNYSQGTEDIIPAHADIVDSLDYECELAVILGKDACNVPAEKAGEYIFGYTVFNDVSARNLQTRHKQWYFGKSLDGFSPMGPCILSADEISFPPKLQIASFINGEKRQDSNTEYLINGIDRIIEVLSRGMTLKAGTVIATGTPAGVGMGMTPPTFLKPGDTVDCVIEKIGTLRNYIR